MKKNKYLLVGMVLITLVLSAASSFSFSIVDNKNAEIFRRYPASMGPVLEVTTDKTVYNLGEPVVIFLTNVGDEEIVYQEATYCWHELEPGEYVEWLPWDQTNQQGQQVPVGEYIVEGFLSGSSENYVDNATFYISNSNGGDELDQYQINHDEGAVGPIGDFPGMPYNVTFAQSFIPQKEILTRVQLYMGKIITAFYPCIVAIRDNLTEENLVKVSIDPDEFVVYPNNLTWEPV